MKRHDDGGSEPLGNNAKEVCGTGAPPAVGAAGEADAPGCRTPSSGGSNTGGPAAQEPLVTPLVTAESRAAFAARLGDYMATRITPWPDEDAMREAVRNTVDLMLGEARHETLALLGSPGAGLGTQDPSDEAQQRPLRGSTPQPAPGARIDGDNDG